MEPDYGGAVEEPCTNDAPEVTTEQLARPCESTVTQQLKAAAMELGRQRRGRTVQIITFGVEQLTLRSSNPKISFQGFWYPSRDKVLRELGKIGDLKTFQRRPIDDDGCIVSDCRNFNEKSMILRNGLTQDILATTLAICDGFLPIDILTIGSIAMGGQLRRFLHDKDAAFQDVILYCKAGRDRSVGCSRVLGEMCSRKGLHVEYIHLCQAWWRSGQQKCLTRGGCVACFGGVLPETVKDLNGRTVDLRNLLAEKMERLWLRE